MEKIKDFSNNEVIHVKKDGIEYLKFRALEKYSKNLECLVTLRHGGESTGVYASLNFRLSGKDPKKNVFKNLEKVCNSVKIDSNDIYKGYQDHTDNVIYLTDENKEEFSFKNRSQEKVDGYITDKLNIGTLVTTADCNPIVIYDPIHNAYANIHSGWKGTIQKIYLKALEQMNERFNTEYSDVIVCVGPSVLKCCFSSMDNEFKKKFTDVWNYEKEYITDDEMEDGRFHIDLSYVIKKDLIKTGVKENNIHFADICTCCNDKDFYSYRSKTQKQEEDYGCMATIVEIK